MTYRFPFLDIKLFHIPAVSEWHLIKEESSVLSLFLPFHKISVYVDESNIKELNGTQLILAHKDEYFPLFTANYTEHFPG